MLNQQQFQNVLVVKNTERERYNIDNYLLKDSAIHLYIMAP